MTPATPAPGSPDAIAAGCRCLTKLRSAFPKRVEWMIEWKTYIDPNCPLHGQPAQDDDPIGDDLYRHADKLKPAGKDDGDA